MLGWSPVALELESPPMTSYVIMLSESMVTEGPVEYSVVTYISSKVLYL